MFRDSTVRLYSVTPATSVNAQLICHTLPAPVLDVRLASTDTTAYAASLDGNVYSLNLEAGAGSFASIGKHEKGVKVR